MALNDAEKLLIEGIKSMLSHDAKLGLAAHDLTAHSHERGFEYLHGQIDEMFALKAAELTNADSVSSSFHKVHSYKYLDDPTFRTAMEKEMVSRAVPAEERTKALEFIPSIISELKKEQADWAEKDYGFADHMRAMTEVSQPEQPMDFTIEEVTDWDMDDEDSAEPDFDLDD